MTEPIPFPEPGPDRGPVTERSLFRELLRLGLPLVAGMGGHALFNIVDLAMVGAYRGGASMPTDQTLAAVGIASLVTTAPIVFVNGISNGSVTVIARAFGARKSRRANQYARHGILLAGLFSVLLGVVPAFFSPQIASAFGATHDDWERHLTIEFLWLMNLNAWSGFLLMQITANMRAVHMSMWPMLLLLVSNVGNILGNWLLVFGNLGFPEYGPIGSAYATLIARGIAAVGGILLLTRAHPAIRLSYPIWKIRARFFWGVMRAGLPVALQWTVRMAAVTLVLLVIAPFGVDVKAAFGVGTRLDTLALFAGLGWGAACSALVSHRMGRGSLGIVRRIARDSALLNVVMMSLAATLYFVFADDVLRLFSLRGDAPVKESMIEAGRLYLRITVLSYPALALCVVWAHAMNGVGSVKTPLLLDFLGLLCFQVPLVWILSQTRLGVVGAWWGLVISHSLLALAYWLVFRFGSWERKKRRQ